MKHKRKKNTQEATQTEPDVTSMKIRAKTDGVHIKFYEQLLCINKGRQSPQVLSWLSVECMCGGGGVQMGMCEGSGSKRGS